jgi:hypothetical protein
MDALVEVSDQIEQAVNTAAEHWRNLPEQQLRFRPSSDAWSVKEIIGHLIDSEKILIYDQGSSCMRSIRLASISSM